MLEVVTLSITYLIRFLFKTKRRCKLKVFHPTQDEAPYQFFPCKCYKRKYYPKKFSDFYSFWHTGVKFQISNCASLKLLNLNQEHSSKKQFFWPNTYKIDFMITSFIKMLELPNFGHRTIFTI